MLQLVIARWPAQRPAQPGLRRDLSRVVESATDVTGWLRSSSRKRSPDLLRNARGLPRPVAARPRRRRAALAFCASLQFRQRSHPAHVPQEVAECPGSHPASPQDDGRTAPLSLRIPAQSRPGRRHQDRPVTPEVAGSSPVAPVAARSPASLRLTMTTQSGFLGRRGPRPRMSDAAANGGSQDPTPRALPCRSVEPFDA